MTRRMTQADIRAVAALRYQKRTWREIERLTGWEESTCRRQFLLRYDDITPLKPPMYPDVVPQDDEGYVQACLDAGGFGSYRLPWREPQRRPVFA